MGVDRQSIPKPVFRPLRVFAVDPGTTAHFESAVINETTLRIPWEDVELGPVGEYVAVVDLPEHAPLDLNDPTVLAQDGLPPSDGDPQFRQQMVYAVAMQTIRNFERALGRAVHWRPQNGKYQKQLTLRPHFDNMKNAWYDIEKGEIDFGYFEAEPDSPFAGTVIFSCLSQDVIAREVTKAIVMGMNVTFPGANKDILALYEGFADLIALFQHFSESDVLRQQIGAVRGDLDKRNQLGAIALQFGQAMGMPDGVRNAFGSTDDSGNWQPRRPDPTAYERVIKQHERGELLVGAVTEAFKKIYDSRIADLRRIATQGTGVLPEGYLHPDLVNRFAGEAAKSARHVLEMCMRALDYMPPVEMTFGDFLRAIITADADLWPYDHHRYRLAFVDAFRSYGIVPAGLGTLSATTLRWRAPETDEARAAVADFIRELSKRESYWNLPAEREQVWEALEGWRAELTAYLKTRKQLGAIDLAEPFEVLAFDLRERAAFSGDPSLQWVIKIVQGDTRGCTLLVDAETGLIRYQIDKTETDADVSERELLTLANAGALRLPVDRPLRVFAFDPSIGVELETAGINEVTLELPWEHELEPGPVGEYVEVVDYDPASACFYEPVDLNDSRIVAQDGLQPSESNPQFHQQMVYAVTMRTIRNFERALGRLALWSPLHTEKSDTYVQRLRIHPHALREANAYYSPAKKALLFGYFPAAPEVEGAEAAPLTVFACLSHDIVAHEVTHALLDGIHRRFNEPSNPDVLAFHEAFADIVALFQHFSLPEVLRNQIAYTRGDLASQNRLGELAQQFGQAIGKRGALRSAIGSKPNPDDYRSVLEPHDRGSILVAAIFDAFLTIYKVRIADLLRIASEGTGVLPAGQLHPDLVSRLSEEAAFAAQHVLEMCIRALDYCPPVDITFGDYLRAIVTADYEFDPIDDLHRRVAFAEAFRSRGIVPENVRTLSVDGLLWRPVADAPDEDEDVVFDLVKDWAVDISSWNITRDRRELYDLMAAKRAALHKFLVEKLHGETTVLSGIDPALKFEVHSLRPSLRVDWDEQPHLQWVIELTQRIPQDEGFVFRGGCTLLVDAGTGKVRYSIKKPLDEARKERQRRFLLEQANESLAATYLGPLATEAKEPFAMLHRL